MLQARPSARTQPLKRRDAEPGSVSAPVRLAPVDPLAHIGS